MDYLLDTNATEDMEAEAKAEITNFKQLKRMSAFRFSELLWESATLSGNIYEEAHLKAVSIEGLLE